MADDLATAMAGGGLDSEQSMIWRNRIREAAETLEKYRRGKANLENRVVEDELWYKLRHWEALRRTESGKEACRRAHIDDTARPNSAWLVDSLIKKHADAMDNIPQPVVLPREQSDEGSAKILSDVLPVVLELNDFESVYEAGWWDKLKHGTAVYGVFWDSSRDNGMGDIAIKRIDLLRIFWEPGIEDIQQSRNLFITELVDTDILRKQYPQLVGKSLSSAVDVAHYVYDDEVDTTDKSVVVDWYYKLRSDTGATVLHYAKFCNDTLLYASENDPAYAERGYYDHGQYPVVLDTMFPEQGTPVGWGYVALCKDPQLYIDRLYGNILTYADKATRSRWFVSQSTGVNKEQFSDPKCELVDVASSLDDIHIRQISMEPLSPLYTGLIEMKIDELKETSSNRDVNSGSSAGGVTAASAIAALQEAGNKASRDMISTSYRAHSAICKLVIELMRQFYDETRAFRVVGESGAYRFVQFSGVAIRQQQIGVDSMGEALYRLPVFDLKIIAQKKSPFSRMEQNERAKELYAAGFFAPERAQESMIALEMMDFEGIDKVRERVMEGQTLYNLVQQQAALIAQLTGAAPQEGGSAASATAQTGGGMGGIEQPGAPTPMMDRLARNATPNMEDMQS